MSEDSADASSPDASRLEQLANTASMLGKTAVAPVFQSIIREQVVSLLQQHDPDVLEKHIHTQYPLVAEELPETYQNVLGNVGPQFEETIQTVVRPGNVLYWLQEPKEWMDDDTDIDTLRQVRECHDIIVNTPGGKQWLERQCIDVWDMAGIL